LSRQCGASNFGEEADVEAERGLAAVSWRAGVTCVTTLPCTILITIHDFIHVHLYQTINILLW